MIEKYYAKQRRNRALIYSLVVHVILIIATAIWLLKPLVEQIEDKFTVDFVRPPQRIHKPKKIVRQVELSKEACYNIHSGLGSEAFALIYVITPTT